MKENFKFNKKKALKQIDLIGLKKFSYLYGFILADGNISLGTRNRGRVAIELNYKDKIFLELLKNTLDKHYNISLSERTRDTNFCKNYKSVSLKNFQFSFRNMFIATGICTKNKSDLAKCPTIKYSKKDFWRGYIDGDGSLGIDANKRPFISVTIKSEKLANQYKKFLKDEFGIIRKTNRNSRDNIYNIMVQDYNCLKVSDYLYRNSRLKLNRKYKQYLLIKRKLKYNDN